LVRFACPSRPKPSRYRSANSEQPPKRKTAPAIARRGCYAPMKKLLVRAARGTRATRSATTHHAATRHGVVRRNREERRIRLGAIDIAQFRSGGAEARIAGLHH